MASRSIHGAEARRLEEDARRETNWKRWGPYLSERQWATVREDYSPDGECWTHFSHDDARSRAYRWGEDGLLGITDRECRLCFAMALWNTHDPFLKERLFGLTGPQGNHGEDVKECYYYLDSTPTHSYMRALYQYPQGRFPYEALVEENRRRSRQEPEYELADTGVFAERSLLRRVGRVRQGVAQRPADLDHGRQPGAGQGGLAPAAHALVPQYVDLGLRSRRMLDEAADPAGRGQHAADGARHAGPLPFRGRRGVGRQPATNGFSPTT